MTRGTQVVGVGDSALVGGTRAQERSLLRAFARAAQEVEGLKREGLGEESPEDAIVRLAEWEEAHGQEQGLGRELYLGGLLGAI